MLTRKNNGFVREITNVLPVLAEAPPCLLLVLANGCSGRFRRRSPKFLRRCSSSECTCSASDLTANPIAIILGTFVDKVSYT